jgi:prepilin-type N-terminal cleavage/methylation domain-containing protein
MRVISGFGSSSVGVRRGFTLIELLVVISIIGILLGITLPVLSTVQDSARRTACLSNLKQVGAGLEIYRSDHDGILPYALPLHDTVATVQTGSLPEDSILAVLLDVVESAEACICPNDDDIPEIAYARAGGPVGVHCSYEYTAGFLMLQRESQFGDPEPEIAVSRFYEQEAPRDLHVMGDAGDYHPGGPVRDRNAVFFGDWRADWMVWGGG